MKNLTIEALSPQNFKDLVTLIIQQAEHHDCTYKGNNQTLYHELMKPDASAKVFLARDTNLNQAVGYVLYNIISNPAGKQLYIEDICVARNQRGAGVGAFLFEEARRLACDSDVFGMCWSVAENNDTALGFYTGKVGAKRKPVSGFDVSSMTATRAFSQARLSDDVLSVRIMIESDAALLVSLAIQKKLALSANQIEAIRQAVINPNDEVLWAEDNEGLPKAVMIACSNLSSFRTVYGYKVDIIDIKDADSVVYDRLFQGLAQQARYNNHMGHAYFFADEASTSQMEYAATRNLPPLCMSDDPASRLVMYGIGRDGMGYDLEAALTKLKGVFKANSFG